MFYYDTAARVKSLYNSEFINKCFCSSYRTLGLLNMGQPGFLTKHLTKEIKCIFFMNLYPNKSEYMQDSLETLFR